jgi:epoxyqueuosine reductase
MGDDARGVQPPLQGQPGEAGEARGLPAERGGGAGQLGDPAAIPALEAALDHDEPLVRGHAAWALGRLGGRAALDARRAVESEPT